MGDARFIVFDRTSRNQLGEFDRLEEAEECVLRFAVAAPEATEHLEIWDDDRGAIIYVDPEKIRAVTAA
jgi:hypothetical protein